jgi:AcrR family transcriptional regulator
MAPRAHRSATHKFHQRRDTIVRAAVEVLNQKGVRGMTLADVAAKLDLVPTAVMYYFHKKEELAAACFHKAIAQAQRGRSAREALELFIRGYFEFRRQVTAGEADQIAVYNDVRAVQDPGVGIAYTQMFRNARSLLLKSPEIAALPRMDCNARTHLLLAQLFWSVVWVPRYYVDDYPSRARQRRLATASAAGVRAAAGGPLERSARNVPARGNQPDERPGVSWRVRAEDLRAAQRNEGRVLSPPGHEGRPDPRVLRADAGNRTTRAARGRAPGHEWRGEPDRGGRSAG